MANRLQINLKGADSLKRKLRELGGTDAQEIMDDAVQAGAEIVAADAKARAPVRTGALRESIGIEKEKASGQQVIYIVGSDLFYSRFVEFGATIEAGRAPWLVFPVGNRWAKVKTVRVPANPFLRPALKDNRKRVQRKMISVIRAGLRRVGR